MTDERDHIPIDECKVRHVYRLRSRNLKFGVFAPEKENGFIGIRTKFGNRFLFTEHHYDNGAPFGTAHPLEDLGPLEDENILLIETMPTTCGYCGNMLKYVGKDGEVPGKWAHTTGDDSCSSQRPEGRRNRYLFTALEKIALQHAPDEQKK